MAYSVTQTRESDLLERSPANTSSKQPLLLTLDSATNAIESISTDFSLQCRLKAIKVDGKVGLLARTSYSFTQETPTSLKHVFQYAEDLNQQLLYSQVFVVQNIDSDQTYCLRMDTVLSSAYERQDISLLLSKVSQDVDILMSYFR
jgi:hypothetical protein